MTDFNFFDSSQQAKEGKVNTVGKTKYPWREVPVGKSFPVPKVNISFKTLRSLASKTGKELRKRFRVVNHDGDVYEVACLPMDEQTAIQSSSGIVDTLNKMGEAPTDFGFDKKD